MKGYFVFKDGRREEMDPQLVGGVQCYLVHKLGDRTLQTIFVSDAEVVDGCIIYRETETKDITANMRELTERANRDRFLSLGIRPPPSSKWAEKGYYPGETEEEHARRVKIMRGES